MKRRAAHVAALLATLVLVTPAHAAGDLETGIADDAVLLGGGQKAADAVADWQRLGVDWVRIHARWVEIAPGDDAVTRPAGFDARNPDDPLYHWAPMDNAIKLLTAAGIKPMLAITGSGPLWTSRQPSRGNPRWDPDPQAFGDFAFAVAKRYGPQVSRYLIWNEPNQPAWLQPQFVCKGSSCKPAAPAMYRDLFRASSRAIKSVDAGAKVFIGTLSPSGRDPKARNVVMRPLQFIRALSCVDDKRLKRIRTGACKGQAALKADGFAYHPHPVRFSPDTKAVNPDNAAIADLPHFEAVLDKASANGILKPIGAARFPLYLTEFGYQTNPPDADSGVTPAQQAAWLQESWYKAWADPRVHNITQYEWVDEPIKSVSGGNNYASWQSGLHFVDGRAKPALKAFTNPMYVDVRPGARTARVWGQVRPGTSWEVTIERRTAGGSFAQVKKVRTDDNGFFSQRFRLTARTTYRFSYVTPAGVVHSAEQTVRPVSKKR